MHSHRSFQLKDQSYQLSLPLIPFEESKSNSPSRIDSKKQSASQNFYTSTQFFRNILNKSIVEQSSPNGKQKNEQNNSTQPNKDIFNSERLVKTQQITQAVLFCSSPKRNKCIIGLQSPRKTKMQFSQENAVYPLRKSPSQGRFQKRKSFIDEGIVSLNKFKLFYKAIMHLTKKEEDIDSMWRQFEQSVDNPFKFDQLIETISKNKRTQQGISSFPKNLTSFSQSYIQESFHSARIKQQIEWKNNYRITKSRSCIQQKQENKNINTFIDIRKSKSLYLRQRCIKKLTSAEIKSMNKLKITKIQSILKYGTNFLKKKKLIS